LVGHGIGTKLHEEPQIPNFGKPGTGPLIKAGMCFAIEPMINLGTEKIYTKSDNWTICTQDGLPSAHFEHTITITEEGAKILTI
jgi:methionyl aminopeptidase